MIEFEVDTMTSKFESIWVTLKLDMNNTLQLGCLYRTDSDENTEELCNPIREVMDRIFSHRLIMGDYNFPDIDWDLSCISSNLKSRGNKSIETIRGGFFSSHVNRPTGGIVSDNLNVLDLIFTNEEGIVSNLDYRNPLGKSNHSISNFNYKLYTQSWLQENYLVSSIL